MKAKHYILEINEKFGKFAKWLIEHQLLASIICIILMTGCFFSYQWLYYDLDQLMYCPDDSPVTQYYRDFMKEYGNDEFIYILYEAKDDVFEIGNLKKINQLIQELQEVQYVKKANSITNIEYMEGSEQGDLKIYNFMDEFPQNQEEADRLKRKLLDKPIYLNTYISEKPEYAAIICEIEDRPEDDTSYHRKIVAELMPVLKNPKYNEFKFYPVGNPMLTATFHELNMENASLFTVLTFFLMGALLLIIFHQIKGIVAPFMVTIIALTIVLGIMAVTGSPITMLFSMIPSIILGIGIATAVHVITEYQIHLRKGEDNKTAIINAVKLVGFPCLFTSITTAIGFGSLITSSMSVMRNFGLALASSAVAVFIVSFTILLIFLSFGAKYTEKKFKSEKLVITHKLGEKILLLISDLNSKYYRQILFIFLIITCFLIYGATKIEVNASWLAQFGEKIELVQDFKYVDKTMGATGNFEILLDSKEPEGIKTRKFMETLQKIQAFAEAQDYMVKKTFSVVDVIKDVNRSMNNNDMAFHKLPATNEEIAQFLLLYEMSGGEELETLLSADVATARMTIFVKSADSVVYNKFYEDLVSYIKSVKPDEYEYTITGMSYLAVTAFRTMTNTMSTSLTLAIVVISIMMIIVFRSFKIGALSMVPNVFPVIFALGFMGYAGIWLSNLTSTVGCIVIGLAVDDTIHFISRYRMEFAMNKDYRKALKATMTGVGHALSTTTTVLVFGFGVFMLSRMDLFFEAGMLTSICFLVALIADFFIAPSLIILLKPFGKEDDNTESSNNDLKYKTA